MKRGYSLIFLILILPVLTADFEVEQTIEEDLLIRGIDKPVVINLKIKNSGGREEIEFYNYAGFQMSPSTLVLEAGKTTEAKINITPIGGEIRQEGIFILPYTIEDSSGEETINKITIEVIDLGEAFEVGSREIDSELNSIEIFISNKINFNFGNMKVKFSSKFFELTKEFSLDSYGEKKYKIVLNQKDFKKLEAGIYTLRAEITTNNINDETEGVIKLQEKKLLTTESSRTGTLIRTETIRKINEGNTIEKAEIIIEKNIFASLFTYFNIRPNIIERQGLRNYYRWSKNLNPGETLGVSISFNLLYPILILTFLIFLVIFWNNYSRTSIDVKKRISFVKPRGGEFALKVSITLTAKDDVGKINIIDKLPPLVEIYEKSIKEQPIKITKKDSARRLEWLIDNLLAGETRVISYIIYSKVGIIGKFALPKTVVIYEKEGRISETKSNRVFFVSNKKS